MALLERDPRDPRDPERPQATLDPLLLLDHPAQVLVHGHDRAYGGVVEMEESASERVLVHGTGAELVLEQLGQLVVGARQVTMEGAAVTRFEDFCKKPLPAIFFMCVQDGQFQLQSPEENPLQELFESPVPIREFAQLPEVRLERHLLDLLLQLVHAIGGPHSQAERLAELGADTPRQGRERLWKDQSVAACRNAATLPFHLCPPRKMTDESILNRVSCQCNADKAHFPHPLMRVILVHGFNATPEMNFHPWLADELRRRGFDVVIPTLSLTTKEELDLSIIMEQMKAQVGFLKSDDILLGHSLGAFIILQYLEAIEMTETPRAVVMVAAPWKVSRPELRRLFLVDLDADVLMWKAREYVVIHSKDDPLVPFEHGKLLAVAFRAKFVETDGDGHFMAERYPVLVDTLVDIAGRPFEYAPGESLSDDYTTS